MGLAGALAVQIDTLGGDEGYISVTLGLYDYWRLSLCPIEVQRISPLTEWVLRMLPLTQGNGHASAGSDGISSIFVWG